MEQSRTAGTLFAAQIECGLQPLQQSMNNDKAADPWLSFNKVSLT